jgi:hypothetical protein
VRILICFVDRYTRGDDYCDIGKDVQRPASGYLLSCICRCRPCRALFDRLDEMLGEPAIRATRFAREVHLIDRIIADVRIQVDLVFIPDGIGLQEPAERGRVDARLVVIHAELGQPCLAGVLEPAGVGAAGDAILVIGVDSRRASACVGDRDDRALLVGVEPAGAATAVPDQRIVCRSVAAMNIARGERAGCVILGDQRIAIVEIARVGGPLVRLPQPPKQTRSSLEN